MNNPQKRVYQREEAILMANEILEAKAPDVPKVSNVGLAALVLLLDSLGKNVDYQLFQDRWNNISDGDTSTTVDDVFNAKIVASTAHAIIIEPCPDEPIFPDDVIEAMRMLNSLRRVVLGRPDEQPIIDGIRVPILPAAHYAVVKALVTRAGREGFSEAELMEASGHDDARKILKRLARNERWRSVIVFAGKSGGRYHIL